MSLPNLNYVVVDQNVLRKRHLMDPLFAEYDRAGTLLVLSNSAHEELAMGTADGMLSSFAIASERPECFAVAHGTIQLFVHHELKYRTSAAHRVLNPDMTRDLRHLLRAIAAESIDRDALERVWKETKASTEQAIKARQNDALYGTLPKSVFSYADPKERGRVITALTAGDRASFRAAIAEMLIPGELTAMIEHGARAPYRTARKLRAFPSVVALRMIATTIFMYRRHLLTAKAGQDDNEDADVENVVIAAYGRGYATEDGNARDHYDDLLFFAASVWG